jgi:hypothetical protein
MTLIVEVMTLVGLEVGVEKCIDLVVFYSGAKYSSSWSHATGPIRTSAVHFSTLIVKKRKISWVKSQRAYRALGTKTLYGLTYHSIRLKKALGERRGGGEGGQGDRVYSISNTLFIAELILRTNRDGINSDYCLYGS